MATIASTFAVSPPETGEIPTLPVYRFSVSQYLALAAANILTSDDRVELIDGWIVPKMTRHPPHTVATRALYVALTALVPDGWFVTKEDPIALDESMPEPDLAAIRGRSGDFRESHPGPEQIALIAEVAESSLHRDRVEKLRIYAAAGIPRYWVVNLVDSTVEVYADPRRDASPANYEHLEIYGIDAVVPVILDGREVGRIAVREILA